ncbi:hypothetical protein ACA910_006174 [Epithemia clementina (nom. ined.)]
MLLFKYIVPFLLVFFSNTAVSDALNVKLHGLGYSLRIGPHTDPSEYQCKTIYDAFLDMSQLKDVTDNVRIFSLTDCDSGNVLLEATQQIGGLGLWLGLEADSFYQFIKERTKLIELAQSRDFSNVVGIHIAGDGLSLGKTIQYRNYIKDDLVANGLPDIPVVVAYEMDTYIKTPQMVSLDNSLVHLKIYPFFDKKTTINNAANYMAEQIALLGDIGNRQIVIGETGWADNGFNAAYNPANEPSMQKWLRDFICLANAKKWHYYWYTAYDSNWENPTGVEGHFGLFTKDGVLKSFFDDFSIDCDEPAVNIDPDSKTFPPIPSESPSEVPTQPQSPSPSKNPSIEPSLAPSWNPSDLPSSEPSLDPTFGPSMNPSTLPSTVPSGEPSTEPTSTPTSSQPSTSSQPTTSPSEAPSYKPSGASSISTASQNVETTVKNLEFTLVGVSELDGAALDGFAKTTEQWYLQIYGSTGIRSRRALQITTLLSGFTTDVIVQSQNVSEESNTLTYDQLLAFQTPPESAGVDPYELVESPFKNDVLRADYFNLLVASHPAFANITDSGSVLRRSVAPMVDGQLGNESPDDGGQGGMSFLFIWILAGLGCVLVILQVSFVMHRRRREQKRRSVEPGAAVEMDSKHNLFYTSEESRADEEQQSTLDGTLANPKVEVELDSSWARFGPEYEDKNNILFVDVPGGRLGVIVDTPDDGPALVYALRRHSTLRGQLKVGDRLLAINGEDVTDYTATYITDLITDLSHEPARTFTLMRLPKFPQKK